MHSNCILLFHRSSMQNFQSEIWLLPPYEGIVYKFIISYAIMVLKICIEQKLKKIGGMFHSVGHFFFSFRSCHVSTKLLKANQQLSAGYKCQQISSLPLLISWQIYNQSQQIEGSCRLGDLLAFHFVKPFP